MALTALTFAPMDMILIFIVFGVPCLIVFGVVAVIIKLGNKPVAVPMQYVGMPLSASHHFCMHCGSGLPTVARFCPNCGQAQSKQ